MAAPTRVSYNAPAAGNYSTTTSPKVTPTFDVVAGDVIIVLCSVENAGNQSVVTPSASGGSVTWTQRVRQPATNNGSTSAAWCWTGAVGATATGITVSLARPTTDASLWWGMSATVYRDHGGVGVVFSGTNGTGANSAPSAAATCAANSAVLCVVNDWNAADGTSRTWRTINGAAETETVYFRDAARHAAYGAYRADTGAAGSITQGLTAPAGQRWVLAGVEILGTSGAAPVTGTLDASAPALTVGPPTTDVAGTVTVPTYTGDVAASTPAVTVGPPTSSITGTVTAPAGSGDLNADLPTVTVGPPTYAMSGTVTAPTYAGDLAAATAALTVGPPTMAWTGTSTPPTYDGTPDASTPTVTVGPPTTAISGAVTAPGSNTLVADLPTIVIGPPTTSIAGATTAPVYAGALAADAPVVTVGPPSYAMAGTVTAPVISGALVASLPTITVGPLTTLVLDQSIPPLPIDGVSLTVSVDVRGLTLTGEARDLEVST